MEASGVDPSAVLEDRWGLDVRDSLNRPVSRARLEADLKYAAAQAAAEGSFASKLPHARAATLLMELLPAVDAWLRTFLPRQSSGVAAAAGVPKPPRLGPLVLLCAFLALSTIAPRRPAPCPVVHAPQSPAILRC